MNLLNVKDAKFDQNFEEKQAQRKEFCRFLHADTQFFWFHVTLEARQAVRESDQQFCARNIKYIKKVSFEIIAF